jgi:2-methylcitrate dehydratase PrpD
MERMAADYIPTLMSRGFHAGPVFGIFGAAVAAAKVMGMDAPHIHDAIAQCVNLAAGNLEGARSGGRSLREGGSVRNGLLAVALAKQGMAGGETVLEGEAGFYHAYAGNNKGKLPYVFSGQKQTSLESITEGLGERWQFLETLYRIYSTAGYNIAHVDVTAALCVEHDIHYEDIERIEAVVHWMETLYPSPAFPSRLMDNQPRPGSTHYFSAWGAAKRGYPLLKDHPDETDPPEVLDLMKRVTIIPSKTQTLFGPTVTIYSRDGKRHRKKATGREFMWDFEEEARRIQEIAPGVPIGVAQFARLIDACRHLDRLARADELIRLTIPS